MRLGANCQICVPTSLGLFQSVQASVAAVDRSGFTSVLPEFATKTCPEQLDAVNMNFQFTTNPAIATSCTYVDSTHLSASLSGASIGALSGTCGGYTIAAALTFSGGRLTGTVTVSRGGMSEVRTLVAGSSGGVVALGVAYYVDSNAADDTANGTTPATPKKTLGALPALIDGNIVRLARGSRWREELRGTGAQIAVEAFGAGPRPIVDGFEINTSWNKTAGRTNVYDVTWSWVNLDAGSGKLIVLRDGVELKWVSSIANCDSTAGSYFVADISGTSGSTSVYVHPQGDTNPASDGHTYEVTKRCYAIAAEGSSVARGIMTRGALHDTGSLVFPERTSLGVANAAVIDDCVALHGAKHGIYAGSGTVTRSGVFGQMNPNVSATGFVLFPIQGNVGKNYVLEDSWVIGDPRATPGAFVNGAGGVISHSGDSQPMGTLTVRRCGFAYLDDAAFQAQSVLAGMLVEDCLCEYGRSANANYTWTLVNATTTVRRSRFYGQVSGSTSMRAFSNAVANALIVEDTLIVCNGSNPSINLLGTASLTRCTMIRVGAATMSGWVDAGVSLTLSENNCIYVNCPTVGILNDAGSAFGATDHNVVNPGTSLIRESAAKTLRQFTVYKGDQVATDQNSVTTLPTWLAGTDTGDRPSYVETTASRNARGFDAGPSVAAGANNWTTPATYDAWLTFAKSL